MPKPKIPRIAKPAPPPEPEELPPDTTDGWEQIEGQLGSNPGGLYKDAAGKKFYLKEISEDRARSEMAANELYKLAGTRAINTKLVKHNGQWALASEWVDDTTAIDNNMSQQTLQCAPAGCAWLG